MTLRPRRKGWLLVAIATAMVVSAVGGTAAQAAPAPPYEQFAGCPTAAQDPLVTLCIRSVITGGHFQMGSKDVPIANPITLRGGFESSTNKITANSEGGLTPVKQQVPGGILGITGLEWLVNFLNIEQLKLYATTELAGQPLLTGTKLTLPIKVHLTNPALGSNCYVGSVSEPITLNLVTGTTKPPTPNEPIKGQRPTTTFDESTGIVTNKNGIYVDNSFAAPGANGCALTILGFPIGINGLVNEQSGLPAAAGTNETIQDFESETVQRGLVYP